MKSVVKIDNIVWIFRNLVLVRGKGWFEIFIVVEELIKFVFSLVCISFWIKVGSEWFELVLNRSVIGEKIFCFDGDWKRLVKNLLYVFVFEVILKLYLELLNSFLDCVMFKFWRLDMLSVG